MEAEGLKIRIDSKGAQQDLAALSGLFDKTAAAANKFDKSVAKAATNTDQSLSRAAKAIEQYAQVTALLGKIKPAGQVRELGKALDGIARARQINPAQINAVKELGAALGTLSATDRLTGLANSLNTLGRVRVPTQAQARNVREFLNALGTYKPVSGTEQLSRLLTALSAARAPTQSTITRLRQMFDTLGTAREIPGAARIVAQLDAITLAAGRASRAMPNPKALLGTIPTQRVAPAALGGGAATRTASGMGRALAESEAGAKRAASSFGVLGRGLEDLTGRFRLSYQAGALFSTMFAGFTAGRFLGGLYEANLQVQKLQKAVLFATGSFDGAKKATDDFISMSNELGLSIDKNIDSYGRFVIASKASNVSLQETNKIYHAVGQALTVIGATSYQQGLAMYGLTEMLQKGIVYSSEFNRQIGSQLPGNAILGARALSELEHRVVTVSEFFQKMHTGTLLSPEFVPAWGAQLEKTFKPLLALAQARPDVAIERLKNSFFVFARQVGEGSFMTSIGNAFNTITAKIAVTKDGVTTLTPAAQQLADTLGHNLADSIAIMGRGIEFALNHFEGLLAAFKGLFALKAGQVFVGIGANIAKAAREMGLYRSATREAAAAQTAIIRQAPMSATQSAVAAMASAPSNAKIAVSKAAGARGAAFGRRLNLPLFNWAEASEGRVASLAARPTVGPHFVSVTGAQMRAALPARQGFWGTRVTGLASGGLRAGLRSVIEGAASGLRLLGPAATAAAIGLAMFSDKASGLQTSKGTEVTYGDIAKGIFSDIMDSVTGFVRSIGEAFGMFGGNALSLGKVVLSVGAVFKATFALMFNLAHALGTLIGGAISDLITEVIKWGTVINDVIHGNITGAVQHWSALSSQQGENRARNAASIGADIKRIFTTDRADNIYKAMAAAAEQSANGRIDTQHTDENQKRQLEAVLRQQSAAEVIAQAAQKFADAAVGLDQIQRPINLDSLFKNIQQFASGRNMNAGLTPSQIAANGAGANPRVRQIVSDAAQREGINPSLLLALGMSETGFNPKYYGWNKGGTSARGPFQLTTGALDDLKKKGYDTSDPFHLENAAPLGAAYLRMAQDQFRRVAGRDLRPEEALLPYKFGGAGAAKLANAAYDTKGALMESRALFPKAAAASANHSLFFADKTQNTPLTTLQTYSKILGMASGVNAAPSDQAPDIAALSPDVAGGTATDNRINKSADSAFKQFMNVIGEGSPGAAAFAAMQEKGLALTQAFQKLQAAAAQNPFQKTFLSDLAILKGLAHAFEELKRHASEAMDPIGTLVKTSKDANDVTALRVKGLSEEADWQEQVNKLLREGYTLEEIAQPGRKQSYLDEIRRGDALKTQLDLQKDLNDIEIRRLGRLSNSPVEDLISQQVAANARPGQSLAQARLAQQGSLGLYRNKAVAQFGENFDAAAQGMGEEMDAMRRNAGLGRTQRAWTESYAQALQRLTGVNSSSIERLQAAAANATSLTGKNVEAMAREYANLRLRLEEPPGFQRWVQGLQPFAERLEDLKYQFADGFADNLTKTLTGDQADWGGMFKSLQQGWVRGRVDQLMSGAFGALGLAQPQTPEAQQMAAATTFQSGADQFASAVSNFATAVTGSPLTGVGGVPALRGSIYANDNAADLSDVISTPAVSLSGVTAANDNGSFWDRLWDKKKSFGNNIADLGMGALGLFGNLLMPGKKDDPTYNMPGGIIGAMSQNTVSGTMHEGKANPFGAILNFAAQSAMGGPGGAFSGKGLFAKNGFLGNMLGGMFLEGGYSTAPVSRMALPSITFGNLPHYAEGTHNTSGIPAVLHPNEAVIPLSRGRKIPVEMNDNGAQPMNVSSNITVIAPDPDAFRKARGSIQRDQNRTLKRAAIRNLTGT